MGTRRCDSPLTRGLEPVPQNRGRDFELFTPPKTKKTVQAFAYTVSFYELI
jgi:hypothetical protein